MPKKTAHPQAVEWGRVGKWARGLRFSWPCLPCNELYPMGSEKLFTLLLIMGTNSSVRYGSGRGGRSPVGPRTYMGLLGYVSRNPRPSPVRGPVRPATNSNQ